MYESGQGVSQNASLASFILFILLCHIIVCLFSSVNSKICCYWPKLHLRWCSWKFYRRQIHAASLVNSLFRHESSSFFNHVLQQLLVKVEIRGKGWVMTFFSILLKFLLNISCLCLDKYASYWCRLLCWIIISSEQMQYFKKKYSKNTPLTLKFITAKWMNYKWIQMRFLDVLISIQVSRFQMPYFNGKCRKNTP